MQRYRGTERRRSQRIINGIRARLCKDCVEVPVRLHDINYHGALLSTKRFLSEGESFDIFLYLPKRLSPVEARAYVVRSVSLCSDSGATSFDVGVEFSNIVEAQKRKFKKVIDKVTEKLARKKTAAKKLIICIALFLLASFLTSTVVLAKDNASSSTLKEVMLSPVISGTQEAIERQEIARQTYLLFSCYPIPEVAEDTRNDRLTEK